MQEVSHVWPNLQACWYVLTQLNTVIMSYIFLLDLIEIDLTLNQINYRTIINVRAIKDKLFCEIELNIWLLCGFVVNLYWNIRHSVCYPCSDLIKLGSHNLMRTNSLIGFNLWVHASFVYSLKLSFLECTVLQDGCKYSTKHVKINFDMKNEAKLGFSKTISSMPKQVARFCILDFWSRLGLRLLPNKQVAWHMGFNKGVCCGTLK